MSGDFCDGRRRFMKGSVAMAGASVVGRAGLPVDAMEYGTCLALC